MLSKIKKRRTWKRIDRWLQTIIISITIIICADLVTGQSITNVVLGVLRIGNNVTLTSGQILSPNGTSLLPTFSFSGDQTSGFYLEGIGSPSVAAAGSRMVSFNGAITYFDKDFIVLRNLGGIPAAGVTLFGDADDVLGQRNGNNDQAQRWYGANGSYFQIATQSELLTILAAASTPTTMTIPANAVVRGVAVYVVTVIPTAATFTVTGTASGTAFNTAAVGTGAGSNDVGTQNTPYKNGAAQTITITPNLPPLAATGQVRVVLMYEIPSPPTS